MDRRENLTGPRLYYPKENMPDDFGKSFRLKEKVAAGMAILIVRRILFQFILTAGNIVLARIIAPRVFGIFAVISFIVSVFGLIVPAGLNQALIQSQRPPTKRQLRVVFTVLFLASLAVFLAGFCLAPTLDRLYRGALGEGGILWLRWYFLVFSLNVLSHISMSLLERRLDYRNLATGELLVAGITQGVTIVLALDGWELGSFVVGNLIANLAGFFFFFATSPWPIGFDFSFGKIKKFLVFGLNFQTSTLTNLLKTSAIISGFIGLIAGMEAVGLVFWALSVSQIGLLATEIIGRLIFPACSRARRSPPLLKSLIEKLVEINSLLSFPALTILFILARPITEVIYTDVWRPGLTGLYLAIIQGYFLAMGTIFLSVLWAIGGDREARNISLFWALVQWVLTIPLAVFWNYQGYFLAGLVAAMTFFLPLREIRKTVRIDVGGRVLPYLGFSGATAAVIWLFSSFIPVNNFFGLCLAGLAAAIFYGGLVFLFKKEMLAAGHYQRLKMLIFCYHKRERV